MAVILPEGAGTDVDETLKAPLTVPLVMDPDVPTEDTSLDAVVTEYADDRDDEFEAYPEDIDAGSGTIAVNVVSVGVVRAGAGKASTSYKGNTIKSHSSNIGNQYAYNSFSALLLLQEHATKMGIERET